MPDIRETKKLLDEPQTRELFKEMYGDDESTLQLQFQRYISAVDQFSKLFPGADRDVWLFSTPGRTEIGGNHTDHNNGRVLAAGVTLDSIAVASRNDDPVITLYSKGFPKPFVVDLEELRPKEEERGTTTALIRGIASRFRELGFAIGGADVYVSSNVLRGSGLSSSASIEVLICTILNHLYNEGRMEEKQMAIISQYSENHYFGKPCGLMDQMACAIGGFVAIDFKDPKEPVVEKIDFDFAGQNYRLLVVNTGGDHADLTHEYAAVPAEMKSVAAALGAQVCREISINQVMDNIPLLREKTNDRAIMRAMHFFADNRRVVEETAALKKGDFEAFLKLVNESGSSSWRWLQNCYSMSNPLRQDVALGLAVTEYFITERGRGACRVHGGGFAGTIQVFLPKEYVDDYNDLIEPIFGREASMVLGIRPLGTLCINASTCWGG